MSASASLRRSRSRHGSGPASSHDSSPSPPPPSQERQRRHHRHRHHDREGDHPPKVKVEAAPAPAAERPSSRDSGHCSQTSGGPDGAKARPPHPLEEPSSEAQATFSSTGLVTRHLNESCLTKCPLCLCEVTPSTAGDGSSFSAHLELHSSLVFTSKLYDTRFLSVQAAIAHLVERANVDPLKISENHLLTYPTSRLAFLCVHCQSHLYRPKTVTLHKRKCANMKLQLYCRFCDVLFNSVADYEDHCVQFPASPSEDEDDDGVPRLCFPPQELLNVVRKYRASRQRQQQQQQPRPESNDAVIRDVIPTFNVSSSSEDVCGRFKYNKEYWPTESSPRRAAETTGTFDAYSAGAGTAEGVQNLFRQLAERPINSNGNGNKNNHSDEEPVVICEKEGRHHASRKSRSQKIIPIDMLLEYREQSFQTSDSVFSCVAQISKKLRDPRGDLGSYERRAMERMVELKPVDMAKFVLDHTTDPYLKGCYELSEFDRGLEDFDR